MLRLKNAIMAQKTNKRQDFIIALLEKSGGLSISQIIEAVEKNIERISKMTAYRDMEGLIKLRLIQRKGKGRAVAYHLSEHFRLVRPIPVDDYFKNDPEKRAAQDKFNFEIFSFLKNVFTDNEKKIASIFA